MAKEHGGVGYKEPKLNPLTTCFHISNQDIDFTSICYPTLESPYITQDLITYLNHINNTRPTRQDHIHRCSKLFLPLALRKNQERFPSSCFFLPKKREGNHASYNIYTYFMLSQNPHCTSIFIHERGQSMTSKIV